jgi:4-amino-4-deoxy-L-arabinose transferase-like glycosyltransferase
MALSRVQERLALPIFLLAAGLRLALWAQHRSLWIDEARLSLNVVSRSYLALLPPLDYDQAAPVLYLWLQRLTVDLFGTSEGSLRLLALAAGVGTVVLTYSLAGRWFGNRVALLAATIAALSPTLIYFSSEAKQYGIEAFVSCAIVYVTLRWLEVPSNPRWWRRLVVLGVVALWMASPAVFVLAGVGLTILLAAELPRRTRIALTGQLAIWWGGSLALAYLLVYRAAAHDAYLRHYWSQAFLAPWRPGVLLDAGIALRAILWGPVSVLWGPTAMDSLGGPADIASVIFAPAVSVVIALLLVIGARRLVRTTPSHLPVLVLAPIVLVLLASVLQLYPISARTTLFYMPLLIILAAAGIEGTAGLLRRPALTFVVMAVACAPLAWITARELTDPDPREHIRPLIEIFQTRRRIGDPIYVFAGAIPAWAMYTTDWHSPDKRRLDYLRRIARAGGPAFENAPSRGRPVVTEGDDLAYPTANGLELYGVPDGLEARVFGLTNALPDLGWAENEARRIRAVAHPGAWLVFSHFYGPEGQLLGALEAKGGRPTYQNFRNGAVLLRYEFPVSGAETEE